MVPFLDHEICELRRRSGEAFQQRATCAPLAGGVDEFERRVRRDEPHRLASAIPADPYDADSNAHEVDLLPVRMRG